MHTEPLLSLIIPVYNTEDYVQKCLDSIYEQTYSNIEIIIVNNGSGGNINKIVEDYRKLYPDRMLKLVIHEKNIGTFHGRGSGMEVAEGTYFTFMDADDRVGVDYFRQMIRHAEETQSEIVVTDLVHEDENHYAFHYAADPVRSLDFEIEGTAEIFDFYYSFAGRSYSMYGIWNKIYKRTLWDRCKPLIDAITEQFALCEDAEYTTIFFSQAKKVTNIHDQYYYHYIYSGSASAGLASSYEKAERSIRFQGTAFRNMREHLKRVGLYEQYQENFEIFRGFHQKCMLWHIEESELKDGQKRYLTKYCNREFENDRPEPLTQDDMFFTQHFVEQPNGLETIREKIVSPKCRVVSFDVFDTAIMRSVWQPIDVFEFMTPFYRELTGDQHSFPCIRISAEQFAREMLNCPGNFREEISLDEIYESMCRLYKMNSEIAEHLKRHEIEIEFAVCFARGVAKDLYDLAQSCGKRVIFVSDTYLPAGVVGSLLEHCGYTGYDQLYVSCEAGVTKASGSLYRKVMSDMADYKAGEFLHIGDHYHVDIEMAGQLQWNTGYLAKAVDVFCNTAADTYAGQLSGALYADSGFSKFSNSVFLRTAVAVGVNQVFANPFVRYRMDSDFNADPAHIGTMALGMHTCGFCQWLLGQPVCRQKAEITFIGEEMEWFFLAFQKICQIQGLDIPIKFIKLKKTATSIPQLHSREALYYIPSMVEITVLTPEDLCDALTYCLKDEFLENRTALLECHGIVPDKNFSSYAKIKAVLDVLHDEYVDEEKMKNVRTTIQNVQICVISGLNMDVNAALKEDVFSGEIYSIYRPAIFSWFGLTAYSSLNVDAKFGEISFAFLRDPTREDIASRTILDAMRKHAFDYIRDFYKIYPLCGAPVIQDDLLSEPLHYLIQHAKYLDRYIFAAMPFHGELSVSNFWGMYAKPIPDTPDGKKDVYPSLNKAQKLFYLLAIDHARLFETIKLRLKKHPRLFTVAKRIYRTIKPIQS